MNQNGINKSGEWSKKFEWNDKPYATVQIDIGFTVEFPCLIYKISLSFVISVDLSSTCLPSFVTNFEPTMLQISMWEQAIVAWMI